MHLAPEVLAADFTVFDGQTVGPQTLSDPGDIGTIEPGGTIQSGAGAGVTMGDTDQTVSNRGTIVTTGGANSGVNSTRSDAVIGNHGVIRTSGDGAHAVALAGANGTMHNTGSIETSGEFGFGALSTRENVVMHNSGSITTTGTLSHGMVSGGPNARIYNSGSIIMTGLAPRGILSVGANGQVVNSGLISSPAWGAIVFGGTHDNSLTLLPGSVLEGPVEFGGGTDTLIVGNGLSIATTFDKAPEVIETNGAPFAVQGTMVAVVDPTGFAAVDSAAADLRGGIFSAVASRQRETLDGKGSGLRGSAEVAGLDGESVHVRPVAATAGEGRIGTSWWLKGFGGYRDLRGGGPAVGSDHVFGGSVFGVDGRVSQDLRLGAFGGLSAGRLEVQYDAQTIKTQSFFGGIYGRYGGVVDFAVTGGVSNHDSERPVANNLAPGGIETAEADYYGYFIAPEVTVRAGSVSLGPVTAEPSIRARYSYLHLESYDESGSAAGLSVESRDVHTLDSRFVIGFPVGGGPGHLLEVRAGVDGRVVLGGRDVDATLLGQSLSFDPGGEVTSAGGFVGARYADRVYDNTSLFISTELGAGTETRLRADAQAGVRVEFQPF